MTIEMKQDKLLLIFSVLFMIGLASAAIPNLGTFADGLDIELKQTCTINGTFCDSCNISSIDYPNGTIILADLEMTKRTGDFNFTLNGSHTDQIFGSYRANGFCAFGTDVLKNWAYYFEVTATGNTLSTAESIVYIIFLIGIIFIFMLSLWASIMIPFRNERGDEGELLRVSDWKIVKIGAICLSYILLMFILGITKFLMESYLFINGAFRVFNWLFWLMWSAMFPLMIFAVTFTIVTFLASQKLKKQLERGVQFR